jgi:hypothetical protein
MVVFANTCLCHCRHSVIFSLLIVCHVLEKGQTEKCDPKTDNNDRIDHLISECEVLRVNMRRLTNPGVHRENCNRIKRIFVKLRANLPRQLLHVTAEEEKIQIQQVNRKKKNRPY